jgi:hypothetical protein
MSRSSLVGKIWTASSASLCAGCLTLYGKLEAAFQEIGGFDSRVFMPTDRHSSLYCCFRIGAKRTCRERRERVDLTKMTRSRLSTAPLSRSPHLRRRAKLPLQPPVADAVSIWATANVPQGASFHFSLPAHGGMRALLSSFFHSDYGAAD